MYKQVHNLYILLPETSNPVHKVTTYRYFFLQNRSGVGGNRTQPQPRIHGWNDIVRECSGTTEHQIEMIVQSHLSSQAFSFSKQICMASKDGHSSWMGFGLLPAGSNISQREVFICLSRTNRILLMLVKFWIALKIIPPIHIYLPNLYKTPHRTAVETCNC